MKYHNLKVKKSMHELDGGEIWEVMANIGSYLQFVGYWENGAYGDAWVRLFTPLGEDLLQYSDDDADVVYEWMTNEVIGPIRETLYDLELLVLKSITPEGTIEA